ncbi:hypothetical protein [Microbacterium sp. SD291]|uniref:hypothetical protein n=1 Tax=Microbacterium sp. SD291 TaxID=2782007 RepID=UPI001A95B0C3|nr:hypothetical protein [Microbacterium sp. SD291]MBO0981906.1 hypothetical protein [Microbacterium sp. SD291]
MNEVQGPTPAGTSRPYRSLPEALRAHRIAVEDYEFIAAVLNQVGVTSLLDRGRYIEAIRGGDGASLHIGKTYTNGFTEDEQIVVGATTLRMQPSEGRPPYFYVSHPSQFIVAAPSRSKHPSRVRTATAGAAPKVSAARAERATNLAERDYGVCDTCFMVKGPSGACGCE